MHHLVGGHKSEEKESGKHIKNVEGDYTVNGSKSGISGSFKKKKGPS